MKGKKLSPKGHLTIGIDLGGTKVAVGLVDAKGKILKEVRSPSKSPEYNQQSVKEQIAFCVDSTADGVLTVVESRKGKNLKEKSKGIAGLGLAAAGPLDVEKGLIVHPANLGDWGIVPVIKLLTAALKKRGLTFKIYFQNDAIAAALGEGWVGRAKNCVSYAMITLGTGVGTGVILNGKPSQSRGMGSEWGHLLIDRTALAANPEDVYHATLEGMASGTGLLSLAKKRGFKGASIHDLAQAKRENDPLAEQIFDQAAQALAMGFYNLSIGYNLDIFTFTGGLLPIQDLFVPQAIARYGELIKTVAPEFKAPIVVSKLGNKAGVIGAARLPLL